MSRASHLHLSAEFAVRNIRWSAFASIFRCSFEDLYIKARRSRVTAKTKPPRLIATAPG